MKRICVILTMIAAFAIVACSVVAAEGVEFNYNGRIKTEGRPFDGTGQFKFSLVSKTGDVTFWANDGTSLDGSEPTTCVLVAVENGLFSVEIGDTELQGMAALDPSTFNSEEDIYLQTWFSDGVHGFEVLQPNRKVVNPASLATESRHAMDLYVDPDNGDDRNSGYKQNKPKRTIQSTWDALPPMIHEDVTIHLADGIYRESVNLAGKIPVGEAKITLLGNESSSSSVRVTGADATSETAAVRTTGFTLTDQSGIVFRSFVVDYYVETGIRAKNGSTLDMYDCVVSHTGMLGVEATIRSTINLNDVEVHSISGYSSGIAANIQSNLTLVNCSIHDCDAIGIFIVFNSSATVTSCVIENMPYYAFGLAYCSSMSFSSTTPLTVVRNSNAVMRAQTNSAVQYFTSNVVRDNITEADRIDSGAVSYQ